MNKFNFKDDEEVDDKKEILLILWNEEELENKWTYLISKLYPSHKTTQKQQLLHLGL